MKVKVMHFVLTLIFLIAWENGISQENPSERVPSATKNSGESVYPLRINDARAVYLNKENFNVAADGVGDDAPALQAAIDLVLKQSRNGIVFIPEGTYRLGKTVYLWSGIRLIGFGARRPILKLGENTPGYQEGEKKYMVHFCQSPGSGQNPQPGTWQTPEFIDGTWVTFYSGINNINFEIANGNPAAIAVRYHIAQVCALENIDFNIGTWPRCCGRDGKYYRELYFSWGSIWYKDQFLSS